MEKSKLAIKESGMKFDGFKGTFYVIDTLAINGHSYYLYESERYGEDAYHLIVNDEGTIIIDDSVNSLEEDLKEFFGDLWDRVLEIDKIN